MAWGTGTLYGFDLETTGGDPFTDRIVTATVVKVVDGQLVDKRDWLVDPGIEIPEAATKIHGITTEQARSEGQPPATAVVDIVNIVAGVLRSRSPLVVFNAAYDLTLLSAECQRHGSVSLADVVAHDGDGGSVGDGPWQTVIDPMVLAKGLEHVIRRKFVKGRKFTLGDLCGRYGVTLDEADAHTSTGDALAAAQLAIALAGEDDYLGAMAPAELFTLQRTWRRTQQDGLRAYFDQQGIDHDGVDPGWPLHTSLLGTAVVA